MAIRMQQRRGTATQWANANPVLGAGEIGWESNTNKFKIGDGVNEWADLPYFLDEDTLAGSIDDYIPLTQKGAANGVATLDSSSKLSSSQIPTTLATLNSPALTGTPTAPTASAGTNSTQIATTAFVSTAVSNLVDAAPAALDTLNELAAALNDDASFSTTVTNALAGKANSSHTHSLTDITGVTATASELNILDGATLSTTELNYVDGVTSSIQTQLDGKQATLPSQTSNSGKFLSTNGTTVSWQTVPGTTMSDTAPASPSSGDRWVKTTTWQEYIYFDGYWVEI